MEKEMKIYHVETQEDYDDLMVRLEEQGYEWFSGKKPTDINEWEGEETAVYLNECGDYKLTYGYVSTAREAYSNIDIIKHKAKGVEKMEKVVVPQFVTDWYEENKKGYILGAILDKLEKTKDENIVNWRGSCHGRHKNNLGNAQEVIAKMHMYDYEVEEEKKYYWRKKKEYCLGFETEDEVFIRYYYKKNKMYLGNRPVYLFLVPSYEPYKTKFTEKEVRELVSEEDFNKLERVEADNV